MLRRAQTAVGGYSCPGEWPRVLEAELAVGAEALHALDDEVTKIGDGEVSFEELWAELLLSSVRCSVCTGVCA